MLGRVRKRQEDESPEIAQTRPYANSRTKDFYKAVMVQAQRLRLAYAYYLCGRSAVFITIFVGAKTLISQGEQFSTPNFVQSNLMKSRRLFLINYLTVSTIFSRYARTKTHVFISTINYQSPSFMDMAMLDAEPERRGCITPDVMHSTILFTAHGLHK